MSQDVVFDFLKLQRLTGEQKFWRKHEIHKALVKSEIISPNYGKNHIGRMVNKLYAHGFLDIEIDKDNIMILRYRLKDKYINLLSLEEASFWFKDK